VNTIRVMTYQVDGCCGRDGRIDAQRVLEVIANGAADLVALQGVDGERTDQGRWFGEQLGMSCHMRPSRCGNAFLSYLPLRGVRDFDLGGGGVCQRADLEIDGKRVHLFNVALKQNPLLRRLQISRLLGPDLLGSRDLVCPTMVLGDYADFWWGPGNLNLAMALRQAPRPLWHATYPAFFPLFGQDRAYLRGEVKIVESSVMRQRPARQASSHLPMILTIQVNDPRKYLRQQEPGRRRLTLPASEPICS